jgi:hypothetical protein
VDIITAETPQVDHSTGVRLKISGHLLDTLIRARSELRILRIYDGSSPESEELLRPCELLVERAETRDIPG